MGSLAGTLHPIERQAVRSGTKLHLTLITTSHLEVWVQQIHQPLYMSISAEYFAKPLMCLHFCGCDDKVEQGNIPAYKFHEGGNLVLSQYSVSPSHLILGLTYSRHSINFLIEIIFSLFSKHLLRFTLPSNHCALLTVSPIYPLSFLPCSLCPWPGMPFPVSSGLLINFYHLSQFPC